MAKQDKWYLHRTEEYRRQGYKMVREAGFNSAVARRLRSWHHTKIKVFVEVNDPKASWNNYHCHRNWGKWKNRDPTKLFRRGTKLK